MKAVIVKPLLCSLLMGAAVYGLWQAFGGAENLSRLMLLAGVVACVAAGVAVYGLAAWKTGTVKAEDLPARLRRRKHS